MLYLSSAPASEPISTADAKTHLRVTSSDDDTYIDTLVKSARVWVEGYLNRALITQTWILYLDEWPYETCGDFPDAIILPYSPVQSVTSIVYTDTDGDSQTLSASNYTVDIKSDPARIVPSWGNTWPSIRAVPNAIAVTYVCGYGLTGASVPANIIHAMKMMIGHYYENREDTSGFKVEMVPQASLYLLAPYKVEVLR